MKAKLNSFLVLLALSSAAHGAALTWSGGSGDWQNGVAGGWSAVWNNATPGPDTGTFNGPGGTVSVKSAITTGAAALAFDAGNYTLSSASPFTITLGNNNVNLAAGVTIDISSGVTISRSGGPTITGANTTTSILNINSGGKFAGTSANNATINAATVNVNTGGSLDNPTSWVIGNGIATVLNIAGGTVNVGATNSNLVVCNSSTLGASGEITLTAGSINLSTTTASTGLRFGANATNTTAVTGTFNLNGGTLNALGVLKNGANTGMNATFNFHGGKLKATQDNATFVTNLNKAYVKSGGAIIDSNGKNVTIPQALIEDPSSTGGGLTKEGLGTLTLTGANTYTGATIINGGSLRVVAPGTGTAPITATTINSGGRLGVTTGASQVSVTGAVTVNTDGGFEANVGTYNASNVSGLSIGTLNAAGNYKIDLTGTAIPICDITVLTYTPANKTGSGTPSVGTLPLGCTATVEDTGSAIILHVLSPSATAFTWSKGDGNWDTSSLNWNTNAAAYAEPAVVTFPDLVEAGNGVNEVNVTANRSPFTVTINNAGTYATNAYSFSGSGGISGATGVTKTGAGVVTFSNPNSYSGTLAITGGHAIKAAADTTSGNITVADTCTFALSGVTDGSGQTITVAGPGATAGTLASGTLTQRGSLQSLSGNNTWDGNIILSGTAGTGGNTRIGVQNGASLTLNGNISESVVGMSPFFRAGDSATDTITINGLGSWTGPTRLFSNGGVIKLGGSNRFPTGSLLTVGTSAGGTTLDLAGNSQTVAGLDGSSSGKVINTVGASSLTSNPAALATFPGVIQDNISLVIGGTAIQSLSGANTYTGNTTVNTGGALTIAATGKLRFNPTTNGVTNSVGGTGTVVVDGKFVVDLTGATVANGNSWTLINKSTLAATFNATTFGIETSAAVPVAFTDPDADKIWTLVDGSNTWSFNEADGKLTVASAVSGYAAWQLANAPGQTVDQDHDYDGVKNGIEYFMGQSGSGFTANPPVISNAVTWPMGATYTGTYGTDYLVQTSSDLNTWTPATVGVGAGFVVVTPATSVTYTLPTGSGKLFVRLLVNPN